MNGAGKPGAPNRPWLIVGVGNEFRSDDGVGPAAALRLRKRLPTVAIEVCDGQAAHLLTRWTRADTVILIDAMCSGAEPGTVRRFEVPPDTIAAPCHLASTHGVGLAEAVALGAALDRLPRRLILYAVEGATFREGIGLSAEVEHAINTVVERVIQEAAGAQDDATDASTGGKGSEAES